MIFIFGSFLYWLNIFPEKLASSLGIIIVVYFLSFSSFILLSISSGFWSSSTFIPNAFGIE